MTRPSYLLLGVVLFFAALLSIPSIPTGEEPGKTEPVVLRMGGGPLPKGTVELAGKVINVVGWPLAGAKVTTDRDGVAATTDADGWFRLQVADGAALPLMVTARDGMQAGATAVLPQEDGVVLVAGPPLPWLATEADRSMPDSGLTGEGLVEDEDGQPVQSAVVTVLETGVCVRADDQGRYRVDLPEATPSGSFHLVARDQNNRVVRAEVIQTQQQRGLRPLPTLKVTPGQEVTGFLKDGAGNPAGGAGLVLSGGGQVRRVITGDGGEFGIRGLLAGDYQLSALPHRGWVGFNRELSVGEGDARDVELQLRPERPLTILVQDAAGEPQADVLVVAQEADYRMASGTTDARGRVVLRGLGDGKLTFTAYGVSEGVSEAVAPAEIEILRYEASQQRLVIGR